MDSWTINSTAAIIGLGVTTGVLGAPAAGGIVPGAPAVAP
jgi:hypothetical protein